MISDACALRSTCHVGFLTTLKEHRRKIRNETSHKRWEKSNRGYFKNIEKHLFKQKGCLKSNLKQYSLIAAASSIKF